MNDFERFSGDRLFIVALSIATAAILTTVLMWTTDSFQGHAPIAQQEEQQPSKLQVRGSSPLGRTKQNMVPQFNGQNSGFSCLRQEFDSPRDYHKLNCGSSSVGRASAFQADCRRFEPDLPLHIIEHRLTCCSDQIKESNLSLPLA